MNHVTLSNSNEGDVVGTSPHFVEGSSNEAIITTVPSSISFRNVINGATSVNNFKWLTQRKACEHFKCRSGNRLTSCPHVKKVRLDDVPCSAYGGLYEVHNLIIDPDHNKINNYTQAFVSEQNRLNRKRYKKMKKFLTKGNKMFC